MLGGAFPFAWDGPSELVQPAAKAREETGGGASERAAQSGQDNEIERSVDRAVNEASEGGEHSTANTDARQTRDGPRYQAQRSRV
jgi:hypothetical protein